MVLLFYCRNATKRLKIFTSVRVRIILSPFAKQKTVYEYHVQWIAGVTSALLAPVIKILYVISVEHFRRNPRCFRMADTVCNWLIYFFSLASRRATYYKNFLSHEEGRVGSPFSLRIITKLASLCRVRALPVSNIN